MKIIEINEGTKTQYKVTGSKVAFRNGELTLDSARYERDFAVHLDICEDAYGMLTMGVSRRYVAQLDVPPRRYIYEDDGVDNEGNPKQKQVAVPFDPDNATLTLWATEVQ